MATDTDLKRTTVGDLVCSTRGALKPARASFTEVMAGECTAKRLTAGDYPSAQCMAVFEKRVADRLAAEQTTTTPTTTVVGLPEEDEEFAVESFAVPATLLALAALLA